MKIKNGFTLIETIIALIILSLSSVTIVNYGIKKKEEYDIKKVGLSINVLLKGIDNRIQIDGYDIEKWNKIIWTNKEITNLISNQLQGINSKCNNGSWTPINGENDIKLVDCNLFEKRFFEINAKIEKDNLNDIKKVIIDYSIPLNKNFTNNFNKQMKSYLYAETNQLNIKTGSVFYKYINKETEQEIKMSECIKLKEECAFRTVLDRQGRSELLLINGKNKMIGSKLKFKINKYNSNLTCLKWSYLNSRWTVNNINCGIGLERGSLNVNIAANTLVAQNISLNKLCPIYKNINGVISNTSNFAPCGLINETTAIQLVEKSYAKELSSNKIESITFKADTANVKNIEVKNILKVLNKTNTINIEVENKIIATDNKKILLMKNSKTKTIESINNKKIHVEIADLPILETDSLFRNVKINTNILKANILELSNLSALNGYSHSNIAIAKNKMEAPIGNFKNINKTINDLLNKITDLNQQIDEIFIKLDLEQMNYFYKQKNERTCLPRTTNNFRKEKKTGKCNVLGEKYIYITHYSPTTNTQICNTNTNENGGFYNVKYSECS